jgi:hypothetical protein
MTSRSSTLKNRSSVAKRTATALRSIADDPAFDIADRGVLLAAAKIADSFGYRKAKESLAAKAEEIKFERDSKAARAKIEPIVMALPHKTIAEKVVTACLVSHFNGYLIRTLSQPTLREIQWELDYYTESALRDTIASAAYWVATGKGNADQAIKNIESKHLEVKTDPKIISLAQRFESALQTTQMEAA